MEKMMPIPVGMDSIRIGIPQETLDLALGERLGMQDLILLKKLRDHVIREIVVGKAALI